MLILCLINIILNFKTGVLTNIFGKIAIHSIYLTYNNFVTLQMPLLSLCFDQFNAFLLNKCHATLLKGERRSRGNILKSF